MIRSTIALLVLLLWDVPVRAADNELPLQVTAYQVGFHGHYKLGRWTPIELTLRGSHSLNEPLRGRIDVTLPDGDGVPASVSTSEVTISPDAESTAQLFACFGRRDAALSMKFHDAQGELPEQVLRVATSPEEDSRRTALTNRDEFILVVGPSLGIKTEPSTRHRAAGRYVVELEDDRSLPDEWYGYDTVDAVIVSTSRLDAISRLTSGGERFDALDRWVRLGGRLVLCVGSQAPALLAVDSTLSRIVPGEFSGEMVRLRLTRAWEGFAETKTRLAADEPLVVPRLVNARGQVAAREGDLPLVVRAPHGFGEVVFVAADLDRPPLSTWEGRAGLIDKLLGRAAHRTGEEDTRSAAPNRFGITDISGQLRAALEQVPGVSLIPFYVVAGLTVLYVALLWPLDDLFVRRFIKRPGLAWITFPLVVVCFSIGSYALAYWYKGSALRTNQVDLVDVNLDSGLVRGTTWINVFSPRTETYDVTLRPRLPDGRDVDDPEMLFGWWAMPGGGLGGMDSPVAQAAQSLGYRFGPKLEKLEGVPIQQWSTKGFLARWSSEAEGLVEADLVDEGDAFVRGRIVNRLEVPLVDCLLAYGPYAYTIGELAPGGSIVVGPELDTTELQTRLTRSEVVFDPAQDRYVRRGDPYDASTLDVAQVLMQMMFFRAAGGPSYSRLFNGYQSYIDQSEQLGVGRAILVCRGGRGFSQFEITVGGEPTEEESSTSRAFCRFVIPVRHESRAAPQRSLPGLNLPETR